MPKAATHMPAPLDPRPPSAPSSCLPAPAATALYQRLGSCIASNSLGEGLPSPLQPAVKSSPPVSATSTMGTPPRRRPLVPTLKHNSHHSIKLGDGSTRRRMATPTPRVPPGWPLAAQPQREVARMVFRQRPRSTLTPPVTPCLSQGW